ncbi:MAG: hypothetical protein DIU71_11685 [Proteobacteria bacterium]|nr:MAG: hypothetical protein DIU71_11685 [Pseudomonadota bacterium]
MSQSSTHVFSPAEPASTVVLRPAIAATALAMLMAPLGLSFILAVLFAAAVIATVVLQPRRIATPLVWWAPSALLVAFAVLNALVAQQSMTASGAQPASAALVLSMSVVLHAIGFVLGLIARRTLLGVIVVYALIRVVSSAFVPWVSLPLEPYLSELYRYETYEPLGLGLRFIFPGDIAVLAGWMLAAGLPFGRMQRTLLLVLFFLAALGTLARFIIGALMLLEVARVTIVWFRQGRWGLMLSSVVLFLALGYGWMLFGVTAADQNDLVESRVVATSSNVEKFMQYEMFGDALLSDWRTALFGAGIGEHLEVYVRDPDHPFQYEAQVPSFAYQLGIPGMLLWMAAILAPFIGVGRALAPVARHTGMDLAVILVALLVIAGGFLNPILMLPQNSILFAALGAIFVARDAHRSSAGHPRRSR